MTFPLRKGPSGVPTNGEGGSQTLAQTLRNGNTTGDVDGNSDILMSNGDRIEDEAPGHGLVMGTKDGIIGSPPAGINVVKGSGVDAGQSGAAWTCSGGNSSQGCVGTTWGCTQATDAEGGGWACTLGGGGEGGDKGSGFFTIITANKTGIGTQGCFYITGPGAFLGVESRASIDSTVAVPGYWVRNNLPIFRDGTNDYQLAFGNHYEVTVFATTTQSLPAYTYNNGTGGLGATITANANGAFPVLDGVTLIANDPIRGLFLLNNGANQAENGIYMLTAQGDGGTPYAARRYAPFDTSDGILLSSVRVARGIASKGIEYIYSGVDAPIVGTTALAWSPTNSTDPNQVYEAYDDFGSGQTGITVAASSTLYIPNNAWALSGTTGTGGQWSAVGAGSHNELGVGILTLGTTAASNSIISRSDNIYPAIADEFEWSFRFAIPTLSDGTNTFNTRIGYGSSNTQTDADGIFIDVGNGTSTITVRKAGVSTSVAGPAIAAGSFYRFSAYKAAGESTLHLYVDGVEYGAGTFVSATIPYGTAMRPQLGMLRSAGAVARTLQIDWVKLRYVWPARRAA